MHQITITFPSVHATFEGRPKTITQFLANEIFSRNFLEFEWVAENKTPDHPVYVTFDIYDPQNADTKDIAKRVKTVVDNLFLDPVKVELFIDSDKPTDF